MTDQLTQDLTSLFATTATGAEIPPLPLAQVVAQGRSLQQVRRRRTALWSVAAAAVAVVAVTLPVAIASHHHADGPAPAQRTSSPSPHAGAVPSTPTTLPYLQGKEVHFNHRSVTLDARPNRISSTGDTTLFWDPKTERWMRVWATDGSVEPFGPAYDDKEPWKGWSGLMLSVDGRTLAVLTHPTQDTSRITEYDAQGQEEIGHVDLDVPFANSTGGGDSVTVVAVNASGRIYWIQEQKGDGGSSWMWEPTMKAPVRLQTTLGFFNGSYPPNGAITDGGAAVTFTDAGEPQPIPGLTDVDLKNALWSPDGTVLALDNAAGPQLVTFDGSGEPVRPPTDFTIQKWIGFESDAYVIGAATVDNVPSLIRCATDHSACATIDTLPADWESSLSWASSPPSETAADPATADAASGAGPVSTSLEGTTLEYHGRTYEVGRNINVLGAGDTVLIGHWGKRITWRTIRDGKLVPLPYGEGTVPDLNPDGTRAIVVTNPTPDTSRITVYDTSSDVDVAHVDVDLPPTCCDGGTIQDVRMDAAGIVRWTEVRGTASVFIRWVPGGNPAQVDRL